MLEEDGISSPTLPKSAETVLVRPRSGRRLAGTWLWWRMHNRSVPVVAPTPIAPYTVARACEGAVAPGAALSRAVAPGAALSITVECYRWRVDESRRTSDPPMTVDALRVAYDACASAWAGVRAARSESTCDMLDSAPAYNTWAFPGRAPLQK